MRRKRFALELELLDDRGQFRSERRRVAVAFVVVTNVIAGAYTSVWHQAGTIAVMPYIARLARTADLTRNGGVLFATPCHQTPFYSHVHADVAMSFLDCSPDVPPGEDASARFAADPALYLSTTYDAAEDAARPSLPRVVVLFDADARRAALAQMFRRVHISRRGRGCALHVRGGRYVRIQEITRHFDRVTVR